MEFLYHSIIGAALLAASPYLLFRAGTDASFRRDLLARLGGATALTPMDESIWIHASSVGEVRTVTPLFRALQEISGAPPAALSVFTATGLETAASANLSPRFRLPPDFPIWTHPLFDKLHPRLLILVESEFWPGILHRCRSRGVPVLLVNGRISDRSFRRYSRCKALFRWMTAPVSLFSMRTPLDAERVRLLGVPEEKVRVTGNLKFDVAATLENHSHSYPHAPRGVVFGSTRPGDEEPIADAIKILRREFSGMRFVLAPRHIQRCPEIISLLQRRDLNFRLFSELAEAERLTEELVLVDRMGELARLYGSASAAFVGGGFNPDFGGQNILEPAACRRPVLFGPHMSNFEEEARLLRESGGGIQLSSPDDLLPELRRLLSDPSEAAKRGELAWNTLQTHRGALQKNIALADALLRYGRC